MRVLVIAPSNDNVATLTEELRNFWAAPMRVRSSRAVFGALGMADAVLVSFDPHGSAMNGVEVCRAIRARSAVPMVGLVGTAQAGERLLDLRVGVDDYLCRPYRAATLIAKLDEIARQRNRAPEPPEWLRIEDVTIDFRQRTVTVANRTLELTNKQYQILALLAEQRDAVCTKDVLVSRVWGSTWEGADQTLYVHINALRSKIGRPNLIKTIRGTGYRLAAPQALAS